METAEPLSLAVVLFSVPRQRPTLCGGRWPCQIEYAGQRLKSFRRACGEVRAAVPRCLFSVCNPNTLLLLLVTLHSNPMVSKWLENPPGPTGLSSVKNEPCLPPSVLAFQNPACDSYHIIRRHPTCQNIQKHLWPARPKPALLASQRAPSYGQHRMSWNSSTRVEEGSSSAPPQIRRQSKISNNDIYIYIYKLGLVYPKW